MKDGGREQTGRKERSDCSSLLLQKEMEQPEEMDLFGWPGGVYGRWVTSSFYGLGQKPDQET